MSHISKIKTTVVLKDKKTLDEALKLMAAEGYKIIEKNGNKAIDLSDRCTSHYSTIITVEMEKDGSYCLKGDPYSIRDHFHTAVNNLQKNYQVAGVRAFFNKNAYAMGSVKVEEQATANKMGKVTLTGVKY